MQYFNTANFNNRKHKKIGVKITFLFNFRGQNNRARAETFFLNFKREEYCQLPPKKRSYLTVFCMSTEDMHVDDIPKTRGEFFQLEHL